MSSRECVELCIIFMAIAGFCWIMAFVWSIAESVEKAFIAWCRERVIKERESLYQELKKVS